MPEPRNWHSLILAHFEKGVYYTPVEKFFGTQQILALKVLCANGAKYNSLPFSCFIVYELL
jgi:hypothetical protein